MEFDFSELRKTIAEWDAIYARVGDDPGKREIANIFSRSFAHKIGTTLKPFLDEITPQTSPELLKEMEFLYRKMISYTPHLALSHEILGRLYSKSGNFPAAAKSFQEAYRIQSDPTRKTWPHLEDMEMNARLLVWLGHSLYHSGETKEGERFHKAGQAMAAKIRPSEPPHSPDKPEPS